MGAKYAYVVEESCVSDVAQGFATLMAGGIPAENTFQMMAQRELDRRASTADLNLNRRKKPRLEREGVRASIYGCYRRLAFAIRFPRCICR